MAGSHPRQRVSRLPHGGGKVEQEEQLTQPGLAPTSPTDLPFVLSSSLYYSSATLAVLVFLAQCDFCELPKSRHCTAPSAEHTNNDAHRSWTA